MNEILLIRVIISIVQEIVLVFCHLYASFFMVFIAVLAEHYILS